MRFFFFFFYQRACMPRSADVSLVAAGSSSARSRAAPSAVLSRRNSCTQGQHGSQLADGQNHTRVIALLGTAHRPEGVSHPQDKPGQPQPSMTVGPQSAK